jgi:hypothetical protein
MWSFLLRADGVLRGEVVPGPAGRPARQLLPLVAFIFLGGVCYGGVMGTFGGVAGERLWQVLFSAAKVPLLLLAAFLIALPSFFILNTLLGVRPDFPEVLRAIFAAQAGLALVLAALAPYTLLWYASSASYPGATLFNGLMFAAASLAAQGLLRRAYRPLVARNRRHRLLLWTWVFLYVFVGVQMAWVLRPFIGDPAVPPQFFRQERTWENAYVILAQTVASLFAP